MRLRTARAAGNRPGQPEAVITDPLRIPAQGHPVRGHRCGECFGPRSAYRRGLFCSRCEREMFGSESDGYGKFIRSERARMRHVLRRWKAAGFHLNG
jgi:hypothetical protein